MQELKISFRADKNVWLNIEKFYKKYAANNASMIRVRKYLKFQKAIKKSKTKCPK